MPESILLVEDERLVRDLIALNLEHAGYQVIAGTTYEEGRELIHRERWSMAIFDVMLPGGDGFKLTAWARDAGLAFPILLLTARSDTNSKVRGLDAGADDYLTKPFGVGELLARVRANLRRPRAAAGEPGQEAEPVFRFGDVEVDRLARVVRRAGAEVHLTPTEYRLLSVLLANAGRVLTHRQLLREVWGPSHAGQSHYLRIYMGHLRQKLEADPAQPRHLLTETAVGYRLLV